MMRAKGKHVVGIIVVLALLLAGLNVAYQWWVGRKAKDYYGVEHGTLIANAEAVEARLIRPIPIPQPDRGPSDGRDDADSPEQRLVLISVGSDTYQIIERADASSAPGMSHVRKALLRDALYDWDAETKQQAVVWRYALNFRDGERQCRIFFDAECRRVMRNGKHWLLVRSSDGGESPLAGPIQGLFDSDEEKNKTE